MDGMLAIQITGIVCTTFLAGLSIIAFSRHLDTRRRNAVPPPQDAAVLERLERIEQVVESTAIEVERIAEANRFLAKLMAEKAQVAPQLMQPERTITPH